MDSHSCSFVGDSAAAAPLAEAEIAIEGRSRHAEGLGDAAEVVTVRKAGRVRAAWLIVLILTDRENFQGAGSCSNHIYMPTCSTGEGVTPAGGT
jgi:voltage-gated potassium channel Kch